MPRDCAFPTVIIGSNAIVHSGGSLSGDNTVIRYRAQDPVIDYLTGTVVPSKSIAIIDFTIKTFIKWYRRVLK